MSKNHRFAMYQNIIYDEGEIINPFECMKLLNYFFDMNMDLIKENKELESDARYWAKTSESRLKEIDKLKLENQMLKHTINRNESYITRLTHTSEWKN